MTEVINGISFEVSMEDKIESDCEKKENSIFMGLTDYVKCSIQILKGMNVTNTKRTIIHELVHAYRYAYGYAPGDEESWCEFVSAQMDSIYESADRIFKYFGI